MTVQVSRIIPAKPEDVWETLTSREGMKAYMMGADVDADWRVGGKLTMRGEHQGKTFEDTGEVRSFEPERKFAYTHVSSADASKTEHLVTFELAPKDGGAEVTVTQAKTGGGSEDAKQRAQYEKTWATMLESLEKAVAN